jgi:type II secretory pathway component PulC
VEKLITEVNSAPVEEENQDRIVLEAFGSKERLIKARERLALMRYELELLTIRREYYDVPEDRIINAQSAIEAEKRRLTSLQELADVAVRRSDSKDVDVKCMYIHLFVIIASSYICDAH